jgi:hypothetical protein
MSHDLNGFLFSIVTIRNSEAVTYRVTTHEMSYILLISSPRSTSTRMRVQLQCIYFEGCNGSGLFKSRADSLNLGALI